MLHFFQDNKKRKMIKTELLQSDKDMLFALSKSPEYDAFVRLIYSMVSDLNTTFIWTDKEMHVEKYRGAVRVLEELAEILLDIKKGVDV